MLKLEEKFVDFLKRHIMWLAGALILLLSLYIRYMGRDFLSDDGATYLQPWYDAIVDNGRWDTMKAQIGNYNMLYQTLITIGSYLPIHGMYMYKMYSIIFDYVLATAVSAMVYQLSDSNRVGNALLAFGCVVLNPIVYMNSAYWAQCDAMYVSCLVLGLLALLKDKNLLAFIAFGMAFAFKLQAIFILPFLLFIWFVGKKFTILHFLLLPGMMIVSGIPGLLSGRSLINIFDIYYYQVGTYQLVSLNYPSPWLLLGQSFAYESLHAPALATTIALLAAIMLYLLMKEVKPDRRTMVEIAFVLCYTTVLFLPAMHERYGYLYEILALIVVFWDRKTLPLYLGLQFSTICTYGRYLFQVENISLFTLAIVNLVVYGLYLHHFYKKYQDVQEGSVDTAQIKINP